MTRSTLLCFARLAFPEINNETIFVEAPPGHSRIMIPNSRIYNADTSWTPLDLSECHLGQHVFHWGYNAQYNILMVRHD